MAIEFKPYVRYEVTEDGKMATYLGDELFSVREVPEQWEYDAERASQRGDDEEADRLVKVQIEKTMKEMREKIISRLLKGL